MSIKRTLTILSILFILVISATCGMGLMSFRLIGKEITLSQDVDLIVKEIFELNILTYQYLLHEEERMKQQWLLKYDSSKKLLDKLEAIDNPNFVSSIGGIRSIYESLEGVFQKILANSERKKRLRLENRPQAEVDRAVDVDARLVARLMIGAQRIVADAYDLSSNMKKEITEFQMHTQTVMMFFTAFFILLTIGILFFGLKSINVPMKRLIDGVKIIGAGNLEHKLSIKSKNEIGELARVFGQLITDLKQITVSRDELDQIVKARTRDLEAANEELSQYTYVVSHDLKAPLRAIHNYSDFLREDLEGKLDGDQKTYLDGLNRASIQGKELVDDLLTLSRIGRENSAIEKVNIGLAINDVLKAMNLPDDVELEIDDDLPVVNIDRILLTQIFRNLIENAVKFNDSQIKQIRIGYSGSGGDRPEFFVQDNGIGIEDRFFEKIFYVFQRLHTREEYEGTGIGLAIVKKAVDKLGGSVRIESKPGSGSTFFIHIPFGSKGK